ncbi:MAG: recombination mediator RecR [Bacteroidota bacterium]
MNFSSKLVEEAVNEFARLPGIGRRTALRLVLYLLKQDNASVATFGNAIINMRNDITYCSKCHNISDSETCEICLNPSRDHSTICVVEDIRDVMAIENTCQFKGVYHILGGIISPMDGVGPEDLNIKTLISKVSDSKIKEVILALNTTMEGDTTNFYLFRKIKEHDVTISTIARGIAIGDELEYVDDITLGRSIVNRTPYESMLVSR